MNIRKSKLILALILIFTVFCATFTQNTHAEYKTYIEYIIGVSFSVKMVYETVGILMILADDLILKNRI